MKRLAPSVMLVTLVSGSVMADILSRDRAASIIGSLLSDPKYNSIQGQQIDLAFAGSAPFYFSACLSNTDTNRQNNAAACSLNENLYKNDKDYKQKVNETVAVRLDQLVKMSEDELVKIIKPHKYPSCGELSRLAQEQHRGLGPRDLCEVQTKTTEILIPLSGNVVPIAIDLERLDPLRQAFQTHIVKKFEWSFHPIVHQGSGLGIADDAIRPFCQNYKDGDRFLQIISSY